MTWAGYKSLGPARYELAGPLPCPSVAPAAREIGEAPESMSFRGFDVFRTEVLPTGEFYPDPTARDKTSVPTNFGTYGVSRATRRWLGRQPSLT